MRDFVIWCHRNGLQLNASKTKEVVIDFRTSWSMTSSDRRGGGGGGGHGRVDL